MNRATSPEPAGVACRLRIAVTLVCLAAGLAACQFNEPRALAGSDGYGRTIPVVMPRTETTPVASDEDAADDAVVLVADDASSAWIAGADKRYGLRLYGLDGAELADRAIAAGRLNNVDALRIGPNRFLLFASNRTRPAISLFVAEIRDGGLTVDAVAEQPLDLVDPYGLCAATLAAGHSVFVGDKDGQVQEWRIDDAFGASYVRSFRFATQTEGCVVDAESGTLWVGEEGAGIWSVDLQSSEMRLVDAVGNGQLIADVEGLDIYTADDGRYLLASSQGDHAYAVYSLPDATPLLRFRIVANEAGGIDGASETDGVALSSRAVPGYPAGLLVVQDGYNVAPDENQNFKIVDWRDVAALIENASR